MDYAEKLKEKFRNPYNVVAENVGVTPRFVGQIARGERKGLRGKGLEVKNELEKLLNQ